MQAGEIIRWQKLRIRCHSSAGYSRSHDDGRFGIVHGANAVTREAYNTVLMELGVLLQCASYLEGGYIEESQRVYRLAIYREGEIALYDFSEVRSGYQNEIDTHIIINDFVVECLPGLGGNVFRTSWSSIDWYIEDAFFATALTGGSIDGKLFQPAGIPLWATTAEISGVGGVATNDPETIGSASVSGTASGGWAIQLPGDTEYRALPVLCQVTGAPAVPGCDGSCATGVSISATDTDHGQVSYGAEFAYSETDHGNRECCFLCWDGSISNPCATIHTESTQALTKQWAGSVTLLPHVPKRVKRMNTDYRAFIARGGLPHVSRGASTICCYTEGPGCELPDPPHICEDIASVSVQIAPSKSSQISVVGNTPHNIEEVMTIATRCPYTFSSVCTESKLFTHEIISPGACPVCPPGEECENQDPADICCEDEWKSFIRTVQKQGSGYGVEDRSISGNPQMIPALDHEAGDARYLNYFASPHWNYALWFPAQIDTTNWKVLGSARNDTTYWQDIRSQYLEHAALPSSERRKTRNHIISEPLMSSPFAGFLRSEYIGNYSSFWGIARFGRALLAPLPSLTLDDSMQDPWSFINCTESFDAGGIVLTPAGTEIRAELDLGIFGGEPGFYGHLAKSIVVSWQTANIVSVAVYLVDAAGSEVLLTENVEGKFDRPTAQSSKYAGSWAQDFGVDVISDQGVDLLPIGISEATLQDEERVHAFQLLSGWGAKTLSIRIEVDDDNEDVEIGYPELHLASTHPLVIHEGGQCSAVCYADGPGNRFGQWRFWDEVAEEFNEPPDIRAIGRASTVLDLLCWRNLYASAKPAGDNLGAQIDAMFTANEIGDSEIGSIGEAAIATHAFIRSPRPLPFTPPGFPPTLRAPVLVFVNNWRECPPIASLPILPRDEHTLAFITSPSISWCLETWSFVQEPTRYVRSQAGLHLEAPTDPRVRWTVTGTSPELPGWPVLEHQHALDNNEGDSFFLVDEVFGDIATASPWHGYFCEFWREIIQSDAHSCWATPGYVFTVIVRDDSMHVIRYSVAGERSRFLVRESEDIASAQIAFHPSGFLIIAYAENNDINIIRSDSWGEVWSSPETPMTGTQVALAIHPDNGVHIIAAFEDDTWKIWRALAAGEPFEQVGEVEVSSDSRAALEFSPDAASILVFTIDERRFHSESFGEIWREIF